MRSPLPLAAALLLAGCAGRAPAPEVHVQKVEVPVPVPCVADVPPRPASPVDALTPKAPLGAMVKAMLAERRLMMAHVDRLEAALEACAAGDGGLPGASPP